MVRQATGQEGARIAELHPLSICICLIPVELLGM
jgi:hypothetical protein